MKDPIIQVGEPILRQIAKPVLKKEFGSAKLARIIQKMKTVLAPEVYGVAIAAPQIGVPLRLFVVAGLTFAQNAHAKVFINP